VTINKGDIMKKFTALFLVFSLLSLSGNLYAKKKGAELIIQKKDGGQLKGELIAVKPNSLLLLDTEGKDVSVGIADIKIIRIVKKSEVLLRALLGIPVGFLIGAMVGRMSDEEFGGLTGAGIGIPIGVLYGVISGAVAGIDKTIRIEGMSDLEIEEALDKLRKKARIRDYK